MNNSAITAAWSKCEATHKAHKDASDAIRSLKDNASKEDVLKAFKDLSEAHKSHKDACAAHKEECRKACMGSAKEDRSKQDLGELQKADISDMRDVLEGQDLARGFIPPTMSGAELLFKLQLQEAVDAANRALDPNDPGYQMKLAMRRGMPA